MEFEKFMIKLVVYFISMALIVKSWKKKKWYLAILDSFCICVNAWILLNFISYI